MYSIVHLFDHDAVRGAICLQEERRKRIVNVVSEFDSIALSSVLFSRWSMVVVDGRGRWSREEETWRAAADFKYKSRRHTDRHTDRMITKRSHIEGTQPWNVAKAVLTQETCDKRAPL